MVSNVASKSVRGYSAKACLQGKFINDKYIYIYGTDLYIWRTIGVSLNSGLILGPIQITTRPDKKTWPVLFVGP